MKQRIAIIGAGLAGLSLAQRLHTAHSVTVFEKSRGVGGRMSTRFAEPYHFDHGTQFFTARGKRFQKFLQAYLDQGVVQPWEGRVITLDKDKKITTRPWFEPHYVACPGMNALCKAIATGIEVELNCEVRPLDATPAGQSGGAWTLYGADDRLLGEFDMVISTAPPAQSRRLLGAVLGSEWPFAAAEMLPCFALMLGNQQPWDKNWIAARANNSPIDWISINATKPGRTPSQTTIVVHSTSDWAVDHVNTDLGTVERLLSDEFATLTGIAADASDGFSYRTIHRWLYAKVREPLTNVEDHFFFDKDRRLAAVGDWTTESRIEDVWLAAQELADRLAL